MSMTRSKTTDEGCATSFVGHPTRQAVLLEHLERMQRRTGRSLADFAQRLACEYCRRVPEDQRGLAFSDRPDGDDAESYFRYKQALEKKVQRYVSGCVNFPAELEEAWKAALPEPYRSECIQELCAREQVLAVEIPDDETTAEHVGELMEAAGAEVTAASPVFADGRMTEADAEHLPKVIRACEASAAKSLSLAARARKVLAKARPGARPLRAVKE